MSLLVYNMETVWLLVDVLLLSLIVLFLVLSSSLDAVVKEGGSLYHMRFVGSVDGRLTLEVLWVECRQRGSSLHH